MSKESDLLKGIVQARDTLTKSQAKHEVKEEVKMSSDTQQQTRKVQNTNISKVSNETVKATKQVQINEIP